LFNIGNILYSVSFFWKVCILNFIVPSIKCEFRDLYNLKIDLVIANEIIHVGLENDTNKNFYLYNGENYWDGINKWACWSTKWCSFNGEQSC
jgi:hypothetical protein